MKQRVPKASHAPRPHSSSYTSKSRSWTSLLAPREPYVVSLILGLAARIWQAVQVPFAAEDAYITFRFAENWAHGLGPVYNAGERVMGFSSPLWTAWLALGSLIHVPTLLWARGWGIAFDLGALVFGTLVLEREHGRMPAWLFAIFFAVYPIFSANSVLGMETSLFLFLLMASAWAIQKNRRAAGILLGLLALVRPESIIAALILSLGASARARWIALGIFALGAAALTAYFGSPIPQSVLAKAATYGVSGPRAGLQWIEGLVPVFVSGRWPMTAEGTNLFPLSLVAFPAAIAGATLLWRERARRGVAWLVAAAGLAILAGYVLLGVPFFFWYAVVPFATWFWLAAIGLPSISRSRLLLASLALFVLSETILLRHLFVERVRQEVISFWQTGNALAQISGRRGTVFLEPIGHVGYVTRMRVIDEVGLVSPQVARRRSEGAGWYADTVERSRPDYLVVRDGFFEKNQSFAGVGDPFRSDAERAAVLAHYQKLEYRVRGVATQMSIYRRETGSVPPAAPGGSP